jgi:quercetin dioxygenase-like cupin family protein
MFVLLYWGGTIQIIIGGVYMAPHDFEQQLIRDGYNKVSTHVDKAGYEYPDHCHPVDTAHVVLKGEMTVWFNGQEKVVKEGERLDVGKEVVHRAKIGPKGCTFLVGCMM